MRKWLLYIIFSPFFSGCMVGPNYRPPVKALPDLFIEDRTVDHDLNVDDHLAQWWQVFDDPLLNDLLAKSLQCNFDLRIAVEKICQARAAFWVEVAGMLPELDANAEAARSRTSQTLTSVASLKIPPIQSFYQAGFDVIWQIDLFGGLRRAARGAYATWQASAEDALGVRIMLLSEVAMTYTQICALQHQADVATQLVVVDEELIKLSADLFEAGLANEQQLETYIATFNSDQAALKELESALKQTIYSMAILLGEPPENLAERFLDNHPIPSACGKIPVGLPSELLRRRPDIRAAERRIAAATEQIGVAVASLFPQISLTGSSSSFSANPLQGANAGYSSNILSKLFTAPSRIWGIGGLVTLPIFDFGKRLATIDEQISLEHQALLTYEKTVISALQEVESDLVAYFNEEERLNNFVQETAANQRNFDLTADLYQAGLTDYLQFLQEKVIWLNSLQNQISSQQALATNLIALYKALGGGWECCYTP